MFGDGQPNIKALRQRAHDLREALDKNTIRASQISVAVSKRSDRAMTASERTELDAIIAKNLELREQQQANAPVLAAAEQATEAARIAPGTPIRPGDGFPDPHGNAPAPAVGGTRGKRYAELFGAPTHAGWDQPGQFLHCIARGLFDGRLKADSMTGGEPSQGGFVVPSELFSEWLDASLENEIVRPRATTWPMATSDTSVPCVDDADRSTGDVGGMALNFEGEGDTMTPQVARLRLLKLHAHRAAIFLEASNDLLADAPRFEQNIGDAMTRALSFGLDDAFLWGSGAGRPLGALVAPCAIAVTRVMASRVRYDDVLAMFARALPGSVGCAATITSAG